MKNLYMAQILKVCGLGNDDALCDTLSELSDNGTVKMIYDLLTDRPVVEVVRQARERSLPPAAGEALGFLDRVGMASSKEVGDRFDISPASACNRLDFLVKAGLAKKVFTVTPQNGGRRFYYARVERIVSDREIDFLQSQLKKNGVDH